MDIKALVEQAKKQMAEFTGLKPVTVTQVFKDSQGWHISLDMLEMCRIPNATDVLGDFEVLLDEAGNMLKFERKATRLRAEPMVKAQRA